MPEYYYDINIGSCSYSLKDNTYMPNYAEYTYNGIKHYGTTLDVDYLTNNFEYKYDLTNLQNLGNKIVTFSDFISIDVNYQNDDGYNNIINDNNNDSYFVEECKLQNQVFKIIQLKKIDSMSLLSSLSNFFNRSIISFFIFDNDTSNEDISKCIIQHLINSIKNDSYFKLLKKIPIAFAHYEKHCCEFNISDQIDWTNYITFDVENKQICNTTELKSITHNIKKLNHS